MEHIIHQIVQELVKIIKKHIQEKFLISMLSRRMS